MALFRGEIEPSTSSSPILPTHSETLPEIPPPKPAPASEETEEVKCSKQKKKNRKKSRKSKPKSDVFEHKMSEITPLEEGIQEEYKEQDKTPALLPHMSKRQPSLSKKYKSTSSSRPTMVSNLSMYFYSHSNYFLIIDY